MACWELAMSDCQAHVAILVAATLISKSDRTQQVREVVDALH